jgi:hypothetical protein
MWLIPARFSAEERVDSKAVITAGTLAVPELRVTSCTSSVASDVDGPMMAPRRTRHVLQPTTQAAVMAALTSGIEEPTDLVPLQVGCGPTANVSADNQDV